MIHDDCVDSHSSCFSDDPDADLRACTGTYLQEEVVAEGATRNIPAFGRFLRVAALANATVVNFSNVAGDAQTPRSTIYEYWRSTSGFEVHFILGDHTAIEVKCKTNVSPGDLKALRALAEEEKLRRYLCVCLEPRRRRAGLVDVLPYPEFLAALWNGEYS